MPKNKPDALDVKGQLDGKKALGWLIKILQGLHNGSIKDVAMYDRATGGIKGLERSILDDMGWQFVPDPDGAAPAADDRQLPLFQEEALQRAD